MLRALLLALGLAVATAAPAIAQDTDMGAVPPLPAAAGAPTTCATSEVTVVVEGIGQGCAPAGVSGADALEQAGFPVRYVSGQQGFICTIADVPADEPCTSAPSVDEYWGYFHAALGDTEWRYSDIGPTESTTTAGTVEGWAFGAGEPPATIPAVAADAPADPTTQPGDAQGADHAVTEAEQDSSGTPVVTIIAVVVVITLLAAGALLLARRRTDGGQ